MPCWTIKKTTVNVSAMNLTTLAEGLKAAGFDVRQETDSLVFARAWSYRYHRYANSEIIIEGTEAVEELTQEVKRAYSAQVVRQTAKQFGWNVQVKPQTNQFVIHRRR